MRLDLGRIEEAENLALQALSTRRTLLGGDHPDVAESLITLAKVRFVQGDSDRGRELLEQGLAMIGPKNAAAGDRLFRSTSMKPSNATGSNPSTIGHPKGPTSAPGR